MAGGKIFMVSSGSKKPLAFRRRRRRTRKSKIPKTVSWANNVGIGAKKNVVLQYRQTNLIGVGADGLPVANFFNLNSIYDPDRTGVGHRPYGATTYDALFDQYYVRKAVITCKFSQSATNNQVHRVGIFIDHDTQGITSYTTRLERTRGKGSKLLLANSNNTQTVKQTVDLARFYNNVNLGDDHQTVGLTGGIGVGSSPILLSVAHLWVQAISGTTASTVEVNCEVSIDYHCTLMEPKELASS